MADRYDYFLDGVQGPEPIGIHAICTICWGVKQLNEKNFPHCPDCDR